MGLLLDKEPRDRRRRKEIVVFLREGKCYPPGSMVRDYWETFARGMGIAGWNEEHRYLFERREP